MLPTGSQTADVNLPLSAAIYVTVQPEAMRQQALAGVQTVIGVGPKAGDVIASFCRAVSASIPALPPAGAEDQVLFWDRASDEPPRWIGVDRPSFRSADRHQATGAVADDAAGRPAAVANTSSPPPAAPST